MKYLRFAAVGLVPLVAVAFWFHARTIEGRDALAAFCQATRRGVPLAEVEARAATQGWVLTPAGRDELLVEVDLYGYRMGCFITHRDGRVVTTREGELPKAW